MHKHTIILDINEFYEDRWYLPHDFGLTLVPSECIYCFPCLYCNRKNCANNYGFFGFGCHMCDAKKQIVKIILMLDFSNNSYPALRFREYYSNGIGKFFKDGRPKTNKTWQYCDNCLIKRATTKSKCFYSGMHRISGIDIRMSLCDMCKIILEPKRILC